MTAKRNYKKEYKKFHSSDAARGKRALLNRHNRKNKTYGNGDGLDASHKGGKIVKESPSLNRGRTGEGGRKKGVKHNYPKKRGLINKILKR
jgi:hypothetical protein